MADNANGQEKSEEPTGKRVEQSRKKGQVPRSRELNTFLIMFFSAIAFIFIGNEIIDDLLQILSKGLTLSRDQIFDNTALLRLFFEYVIDGLWLLAPLVGLLMVVAVVASIMLGGWNFSLQALAPKPKKMNPFSGIKRIFGKQGLIELLKALGKFAIIGSVAIYLLWWKGEEFIALGIMPIEQALESFGTEIVLFFFILCCSLIIIAIADVPFQLWQNKTQLKMTKQEVKDEHKQTDGNPELKARIRGVQREMAQRRMMEKVPTADVIITNPTHFSVALKYDIDTMAAPLLVAKGGDELAMKIRHIAKEHNIPQLVSPTLARAVYHYTDVDDVIPMELYTAVAKVLAYVFQLRKQRNMSFNSPIEFASDDVPDNFRHDTQ